ncbi:MAG: EF-P lysine aminoacylase GenX [Methylococcales bacterium]|nr:EF-P lysine aminoacylase GenX [Methylococcales bacterium]
MAGIDWQSSCDITQLQQRAQMLATIRQFFADKKVLEVETPLLCQATGTDPQVDFFKSLYHYPPKNKTLYLQTSPEFAMKRLLASGCGSIYQICKAFRNGEQGYYHNPEFTLLEWYRVDFDLAQLMDEVGILIAQLLSATVAIKGIKKIRYSDLFFQKTGLNALTFCLKSYQDYAQAHDIAEAIALCENDHNLWCDYIFSFKIQPNLEADYLYLIYHYPASQASLARINVDNPTVADRFEVFINGIELGNGFFELADEAEQQQRFDKEIQTRVRQKQPKVQKDQRFLAALNHGLPDCCGVAVGIDRLLMLLSGSNDIESVLAFPIDRA